MKLVVSTVKVGWAAVPPADTGVPPTVAPKVVPTPIAVELAVEIVCSRILPSVP